MSLINDALKKTQRMRADPEDHGAPAVAYGMPPRPGRGKSGPSLALLVGGALVLVVVAVLGTVLLLRSKSTSSPGATNPVETSSAVSRVSVPVVAAATSPASPSSAPLIVPPTLVLPKVAEVPATPLLVAAPTSPERPVTAPPAATNTKTAPSKIDIGNFIDALHVTGVRFTEGGSKVLMNDKVYKVNDVVDRTLNIKLIEVKNDSLTFVDESGAVYKKNF